MVLGLGFVREQHSRERMKPGDPCVEILAHRDLRFIFCSAHPPDAHREAPESSAYRMCGAVSSTGG